MMRKVIMLTTGRVHTLLRELDDEEEDRRLRDRVEQIRMVKTEVRPQDLSFDARRAVPEYEAALRAYGVAVGMPPGQAGARIQQRPEDVQARRARRPRDRRLFADIRRQ